MAKDFITCSRLENTVTSNGASFQNLCQRRKDKEPCRRRAFYLNLPPTPLFGKKRGERSHAYAKELNFMISLLKKKLPGI
jgi:hypothetical protein